MKIKTDFVTNSSSTSFIVHNITPTDLAIEMLQVVSSDYIDYLDTINIGSSDELKFTLAVLKNIDTSIDYLKKNPDKHKNISFPWSINFDTQIIDMWTKFGCFVNTSTNHSWYSYFDYDEYVDDVLSEPRKIDLFDLSAVCKEEV